PQTPVVITPASKDVLVGDTVFFNASGGSGTINYTWTGAVTGTGTSKSVTFPSAGTYTVTVTNPANGIYAGSSADSTITVRTSTGTPLNWPNTPGSSTKVVGLT